MHGLADPMDVTMQQQPELLRFTDGERWIHKSLALLMGLCGGTAAILYIGPLSILVGRRALVEDIHIYSGILLIVPIVVGLFSGAFRKDVKRLNRFADRDWEWLKSSTRRDGQIPVGKFNAGQKLNSAFVLGAILSMLLTGLVMRFGNSFAVSWRTGGTFFHDWMAYAIFIVIAGHIWFAQNDKTARRGMRTGKVPVEWAQAEHAAWANEELDKNNMPKH